MRSFLLSERYANALSTTIPDAGALEEILDKLQEARILYDASPDLRAVLENPIIDRKARRKVLDEVLDKLHSPPPVARLLHTLLDRGRMSLLPDVTDVFSRFVDRRLNRVTAQVTTAVSLTDEQTQRLRQGLARFSGKSVRTECAVDPDIVGGVVAVIEGTVIDGSLRRRLERMKQTVLEQEATAQDEASP